MALRFFLILLTLSLPLLAAVVDKPVEIEGHYLGLKMNPDQGGGLHDFGLTATPGNMAGAGGLLLEGFGVGSYYLPNRRLNERLEVIESFADRPVIEYAYQCDGPNIRGLKVVRRMEPFPDEASMRVTWTITNAGEERQWVAPWQENSLAIGGTASTADHYDIPTIDGLRGITETAYYPAARNWWAATDPIEGETLYGVYHADQVHAFMTQAPEAGSDPAIRTTFAPILLAPGASWKTVYRVNAVRGLKHVDFATDELALQLDYSAGKLVGLVAAVKDLPELELHARIMAPNGRIWRLPAKRFSVSPNRLARCTWAWTPPAEGRYDFLAQAEQYGKVLPLGQETGSPHGGIDTSFVIGKDAAAPFEAWTDAPYLLDRGQRQQKRTLAHAGETQLWFASAAEKVFQEDAPLQDGPVDPSWRIALARNERESFQLVVRPPEGKGLEGLRVHVVELVERISRAAIPPEDIQVYSVGYVPVRIPSHYEGPTGPCPDVLRPFEPMDIEGGVTTPLWFTIYANPNLPAGEYNGMMEIHAAGMEPVEIWIQVFVHNFTLPMTPALKTDFGFRLPEALQAHRACGGAMTEAALAGAYLENALAHRITLRELVSLPRESADYAQRLAAYWPKLEDALNKGVSTVAIPPSLLDTPELLKIANDFVKEHRLEDRVFAPLATAPQEPEWPRLLERMQGWKDAAPDIPIFVSTMGLKPFLPGGLDCWGAHTRLFDTPKRQNRPRADRRGP